MANCAPATTLSVDKITVHIFSGEDSALSAEFVLLRGSILCESIVSPHFRGYFDTDLAKMRQNNCH